jgi:hypothetical protein
MSLNRKITNKGVSSIRVAVRMFGMLIGTAPRTETISIPAPPDWVGT